MKILKNRLFIFVLGGILFSSITALAVNKISASEITYTDKDNVERTVDTVLDDLYDQANGSRTPTQVATLTTPGVTYTMQNDGYIIGSSRGGSGYAAMIFFSSDVVHVSENNVTRSVSIYAPKDTVVNTRATYGTYNLTVYEWK